MKKITLIILLFLPLTALCQNLQGEENLKQYFDNGIPTLNKSWIPGEYVAAVNKILELAENKVLPLPDTRNGKALLLKLTDFEDYWFLHSKMVSDKEQIFYVLDIQKALTSLYIAYYQNSTNVGDKLKYGAELICVQRTLIKIMDEMIQSANRFLINNPNITQVQKDGLKKMKFGLNSFISGTFVILTKEYTLYPERDICSLSEVFFNFYRSNRESIDEVSKSEFDKEYNKIQKNHKLECVKTAASTE